jgi:UDPglucose 6-dehydrogenase
MKIAVIGAGYVGLVSAACFADLGHQVVGYDTDRTKVRRLRKGEIPIYEPGLSELVLSGRQAARLLFTHELTEAVADADLVLIAVGTPSVPETGRADLSFVNQAVDHLIRSLDHDCVIVCKSTVPVGTNRAIWQRFAGSRPDLDIEVASNPEFLREGSAIADFLRPDRIIVGADAEQARSVLAAAYQPVVDRGTTLLFTDLESAELIKYAANAFLATKLSYINELSDLCEKVGANINDVSRGIGLDQRIGPKFLNAGPGFGGSCFPKDTRALLQTAWEAGVSLQIVSAVAGVNDARKAAMAGRIADLLGGSIAGKSIAVLGVTFKANTDDLREAPSLAIIPGLISRGAAVRAHDPQGMMGAAELLPRVRWCDDPYEAARQVDAVLVLTEWPVYRELDLARLARVMAGRALIDLRNLFDPGQVAKAGLNHFGVGIGHPRGAHRVQEAAE